MVLDEFCQKWGQTLNKNGALRGVPTGWGGDRPWLAPGEGLFPFYLFFRGKKFPLAGGKGWIKGIGADCTAVKGSNLVIQSQKHSFNLMEKALIYGKGTGIWAFKAEVCPRNELLGSLFFGREGQTCKTLVYIKLLLISGDRP